MTELSPIRATFNEVAGSYAANTVPPTGLPVNTPNRFNARVVATGNISLSGTPVIDDYQTVAGDRILAAGQTNAADNGVYVAASGAWSRAIDLSLPAQFSGPILISVEIGTVGRNRTYECFPPTTVVVGVTPLLFAPQGSVFGVGSRAAIQSLNVQAGTSFINAAGFASAGDGGGAMYRRASSEPSHQGKVRSLDRWLPNGTNSDANGGWWELAEREVTPQMFGAKGDDTTNDWGALSAWAAYGGVGRWPRGNYKSSAGINLTSFSVLYNDNPVFKPTFAEGIAVILALAGVGSYVENIRHYGQIRVLWPDRDWTKDRTSFFIQNCYSSRFEVSSLQGTVGLRMNGNGVAGTGMGCVHNEVFLGDFWQSQIGIWLSSQNSSGWCNSNIFWHGKFYGTATAPEQAAGIHAANSAHIYIEGSPYQNNGNHFMRPSLEWVGASMRLVRNGGYRNTIYPAYTEADVGTVWFRDYGLENVLYWDTPSAGVYDPTASGRIDLTGATNPKIFAGNNFVESVTGVPDHHINTGSRAVMRLQNKGSGHALDLQVNTAASGLAIYSTAGSLLRSLAGFGPEIENGGTQKRGWGAAAPTSGTWAQGDIVLNTQPTRLGSAPNEYFIDYWRCETGGTPGQWAAIKGFIA